MLFPKPPLTLLTLLLTTADLTLSTSSPSPSQLSNRSKKFSIGIVLFPGFEPLDVIGPFEILQSVSAYYPQTISFIASQTGSITSRSPPHVMVPGQPPVNLDHLISVSLTATHTFATAPPLDILLIPGGMGNMVLVENNDTSIESFINSRYKSLSYLLSVCTGSVSLARSGVLKNKKATTNKSFWGWVTQFGKDVKWVPAARWTQDGKIWTSSGVAAGMDMTYAFLSKVYGRVGVVDNVMNAIEYAPHTDPKWDPFSVVWDVPGADPKRSLESCVKPVGF
ncbi:hypothetical protein TWF569_001908 [Orbilia oligospora]|nr:hypothetical protein TWF706_007724 [Orbilia oligospora]KAF3146282.1 hypothetical protein TWF594_003599 [Orbilia oligospora]KAF3153597.1 hypothetical protein TWF569_001908 [Orbilia oligospora]